MSARPPSTDGTATASFRAEGRCRRWAACYRTAGGPGASPCRRPVNQAAICALEVNPSLVMMFSTCASTVRREMKSRDAISLFRSPYTTSWATSHSRGVSSG